MKIFTKSLFGAVSLAAMFAGNAYADDAAPAPDFSLSAALAVQSDYRFRGISQNDRDPAPQGTLNLTGPDGFYVGTWLSQVDWNLGGVSPNPDFEMDIYGGKHFDLSGYADLNIEAYYYSYPNADTFGGSKASYFEGIAQLSHAYGPLTLTATYAYSPEFSLGGGTGNYLEGTAAYTINDWLSISGNVGHQWVQAAKLFGSSDYTHYDIGATASYKGFTLDARYIDTDLSKAACANFYMSTKDACSGGFAATLTYTVTVF